ncbi:hypothetical protein [Solwaraspora sp. WMMD792]|uniref:hypothetical protein n=1 Tax=Solwaraspora sp. WMMD792 TaxID=3016099 RepID=UPI0024161CAC|nr:hypothetical protein [Solwaraspora sp. WMMD792]MDG4774937.1 hypothetical protein [Solwaraspora sp. WMMD792]
MRRFTALLGIPLILIAGCAPTDGTGPGGPGGSADERWETFQQRADEVSEAWRTASGRQEWLAGYAPLQSRTVLPAEPGFTPETEQAFHAGWYRAELTVPTETPADGTVDFPDGTLSVPLVSAADAYAELRQGDPPQCEAGRPGPDPTGSATDLAGSATPGPDDSVTDSGELGCQALTVTAATLGTVDLLTSRGTAQVPAWLFDVAELDGPVARVAVDESVAVPAPEPQVPEPTGMTTFVTAQNLTDVDGTDLAYRLGVGACDSDITPFVQEYADSVVVAGGVTRTAQECTDQLLFHPVTVTLDEALGDRTVLDALTGRPLHVVAVG